jgi:hypothetical protein
VSKGNAVEVGDSPAAVTLESEVRKERIGHFGAPQRQGKARTRERSQKTCQTAYFHTFEERE